MHILTLGINHHTAPVEIRERLAFSESDQPSALARLVGDYGLHEAAILSTCNRSELYLAADGDSGLAQVRRFLAECQGVDVAALESHFYQFNDSDAAVHLFRVASGIDSLVVGESEILGQVRRALEMAQQNGSARLLLNELFQRSLRVGKRARAETEIGRGRLSIGTAAVELAGQVFLVGAGKMGALTAQYLVDSGVERLLVSSRTFARSQSLASQLGGEAVPFEELAAQLAVVDIVISATAATDYVIRPADLRRAMEQRRGRPLFLIDIAVPRDIDPAARGIDNVFLFDMDNLEQVVAANRQEREGEIRCVQTIIDHELKEFLHWFNALGTGPLIRALRERAAHLQEQELARWAAQLGPLSADERQLVEGILRGYANKLLHDPLVQIREFANDDEGYVRLDTVRRLFRLDEAEEEKS
ncbi:MAG: glutamyl-tRNA reductase [Candidatus Latescibacteria bacterium]|nr:glutamyl-tRNA reductase [Candidatus Latescibacterota bacterium]